MKRGTTRQLAMGVAVAVMGTLVWTAPAQAFWYYYKYKQCRADLQTCDADVAQCDAELEQCEAETQTFPGDGYPNPDTWSVSGHGPALDYTDNGDLTATDNLTKFVWEVKLAADDTDGHCTEDLQEDRSVHCVNNRYKWSDTLPAADGALFDKFLWALNNTCSEDALEPFNTLVACVDKIGGCTGSCGFAGHTDWEIPNVKKLQSIVDYGEKSPAIDPTFPGATDSFPYWTATTFADQTNGAWYVQFSDGNVDARGKDSGNSARAVRAGSD